MMAVTIRVLAACLVWSLASAAAPASLYERLGGQSGIAGIADTLIDRVASDPKLSRSFKDSNLARIKKMLAEQICSLSGGGCQYSGDSMQQTHAGHHISEAEFYGMVEALRQVLKERAVSQGATNELLKLLAPMKRDIVEPTPLLGQ